MLETHSKKATAVGESNNAEVCNNAKVTMRFVGRAPDAAAILQLFFQKYVF